MARRREDLGKSNHRQRSNLRADLGPGTLNGQLPLPEEVANGAIVPRPVRVLAWIVVLTIRGGPSCNRVVPPPRERMEAGGAKRDRRVQDDQQGKGWDAEGSRHQAHKVRLISRAERAARTAPCRRVPSDTPEFDHGEISRTHAASTLESLGLPPAGDSRRDETGDATNGQARHVPDPVRANLGGVEKPRVCRQDDSHHAHERAR
jgi:hypothetical protein